MNNSIHSCWEWKRDGASVSFIDKNSIAISSHLISFKFWQIFDVVVVDVVVVVGGSAGRQNFVLNKLYEERKKLRKKSTKTSTINNDLITVRENTNLVITYQIWAGTPMADSYFGIFFSRQILFAIETKRKQQNSTSLMILYPFKNSGSSVYFAFYLSILVD